MPPQNSGANPQQAAADHIHAQQARQQLENKIRIKKGSLLDKQRVVHEIERSTTALQNELHHLEMDEKRLDEEVRKMSHEVKQGGGVEKNLEMGLRDTTQNLRRKEEEVRKHEKDIEQLKQQIVEKEREIAEIKDDTRNLARVKEEFRRGGELEHFTIKGEEGHLHEKEVKLQLLRQEKLRKENELKHNTDQQHTIHREMNFLEQEITALEAEHSHIAHS